MGLVNYVADGLKEKTLDVKEAEQINLGYALELGLENRRKKVAATTQNTYNELAMRDRSK